MLCEQEGIIIDFMVTIGEKIRQLRKKFGWTLDDLAQKSRVSKAYLSQIENGESERPSAEILFNISTALGTSILDLLGKQIEVDSRVSTIPDNLNKAALQYDIPIYEVRRLASIKMRTDDEKGRKDYTVDDWHFLYQTISRIDQSNQ